MAQTEFGSLQILPASLEWTHSPSRDRLQKYFPEWLELEKCVLLARAEGRLHVLDEVPGPEQDGILSKETLPLIAFSFGSTDPEAPCLGLFGGVHGLERIGSQVCLSLLRSFCELLQWDESLKELLKNVRVVFFPIINPWGVYLKTRSNTRGVDLMRNAPIEAEAKAPWLLGGHKVSPRIPWFRGNPDQMERESLALISFCEKELFRSRCSVAIDFHSGFGVQDQLWFPYAKSTRPFPHLAELTAWVDLFERTYPHHFYKIEPQAKNYTTSGDLWDYMYEEFRKKNPNRVFIPLALEMGSWMWVKKNPLQIFSSLGLYNPMKAHRLKRILRRHNTLFEFLLKSLKAHPIWSDLTSDQKKHLDYKGLHQWYSHLKK